MNPIVIKVGPRLEFAIAAAAREAGVNRSEWIRRLIEQATGTADPPPQRGMAGLPAKRRKAISEMGVRARQEQALAAAIAIRVEKKSNG